MTVRRAIYFGEDGPEDSIYLAGTEETYHSTDAIWDIPDDIAATYDAASRHWDEAQVTVKEWFKAEAAKYPDDALEQLLSDNISREHFDRRVAGCDHPNPRKRWPDSQSLYCDECGRYKWGEGAWTD